MLNPSRGGSGRFWANESVRREKKKNTPEGEVTIRVHNMVLFAAVVLLCRKRRVVILMGRISRLQNFPAMLPS